MWTSSYIHMNPVKDNIVTKPEQYEWSSYNNYIKEGNLLIIHKDFIISIFGNKENFIKQTLAFKKINSRKFF